LQRPADLIGVTAQHVAAKRALAARPRDHAAPYDFRHPTKLSREHIRALQMSCEMFARRLTTLLTSGLRQVCKVELVQPTQQGIEQKSYEEYVSALAPQTILAPFAIEPLQGTAILQFDLAAAMSCIDFMLGGPGGAQPARTLTDTETALLTDLVEQMLGVLTYAFESVVPMQPHLNGIEYNPQFVQAAAASDAVVVVTFDLTIGSETSLLTMCLPLSPVVGRMQSERAERTADHSDPAHDATTQRLRDGIGGVDVEMVVRFDPIEMNTNRLLTLAVGDVVQLHHRVTHPLTVEVGGTVFARALAGRSGERLAALIIEPHQENL